MITYISPKAPYIDFESMTVATILELSCTTQKKMESHLKESVEFAP